MGGNSKKPSHLRALLRKNWILWKRSWCMSFCEILIPVAFAVILIASKQATSPEDVPTTTYYNKAGYSFNYDGTLNPNYFKSCKGDENGGMVAIVPDPSTDTLAFDINEALKGAGFTTKSFKTNQEIDDYTSMLNYTSYSPLRETLCFAVVINKNGVNNNQYEYMLRFNVSTGDLPDTSNERVNEVSFEETSTMRDYATSGFLSLQNFIDNLILQKETANTAAKIDSTITSRTVKAYTEDSFFSSLKGQISMFIALPLLLPYLRFMNGILTEKEKKIREGMKIMGMRNSAFYLSWFITYFIIFTITSILVAVALAQIFKNSHLALIFLWHWGFSLALMAIGFLISTFFSKAKVGNMAGFVLPLFLDNLRSIVGSDRSSATLMGLSIVPQASLSFSSDQIMDFETAGIGLNFDNVEMKINNYQMLFHYAAMGVAFVVFIILGTYFDKVLPSEFGIRKHPLFCLMCCCRRRKKKGGKNGGDEKLQPLLSDMGNMEAAGNALLAQDQNGESVQVQNLRKVYDNGKVAVDGVSFNMYKGQIFALLGHNGAGKSTTISMITGLFGSTTGTTNVFGLDIQEDLDDVRQIMGICPQHDILFDNLTVREHLEMYAVLKGVISSQILGEVEKTMHDIGLGDKKDYLSKNLSGGQKRKLSIGMAFIGGSKFILLDEPSSGMDTSARRKLWDMLKNYKHDRVVLLTTHFMDEADYLGDRIGIMAEGKLQCLGSPLFLKSKFGIGYNLTMVKKNINTASQPIRELVQSHIPESKILSDVSAEFAMQLPLEATGKFQDLFDELDENLEKLGISSYGVSVTTLEEVFLNVAKIAAPEKHYKGKNDDATVDVEDDLDDYNIAKDRIRGCCGLFWTHFGALVAKRLHYIKRDKRGLLCELILPILMVIGGILLGNSATLSDLKTLTLSDNLYDYKFQMDYNGIAPAGFISQLNTEKINPVLVSVDTLADFDSKVVADQGPILTSKVNVFSVFMETYDDTAKSYDYTVLLDTRAREGSAYAMNQLNNAILRAATGDKSKTITVINSPFKKTAGYSYIENIVKGLSYAFVMGIAMSLLPASLITYIVKEREFNAKHQQIVSGVSISAYWFSNFFVDIIKYLIPAVLNVVAAILLKASALIDGDKVIILWLDFVLYGFAIIPFVYLTAFLFRNYGTAQIAAFFFNFCTGFIVGLVISILKIFDSTQDVAKILQWVFRCFPSFAMVDALLNLANFDVYRLFSKNSADLSLYDLEYAGGDIVMLAGTGIVYMILIFIVEKLRNIRVFSGDKKTLKKNKKKNAGLEMKEIDSYENTGLDDDVLKEMREVEASADETYSIKVDKLRKVYPLGGGKNKVAVDNLSFGVKNGECFALLGVNGAGKTTTFKILSGDYVQTSGRAFINGYEIPENLKEAQRNIGYCPQFDSILDLLTAKEHLYLYAAIKGIPNKIRGRMVEKQLVEMNLKQYENIPAGTYSGGNKRKLSVAIAMIGNPPVVFLDEPSTGMDPEARRFMWNVISRISKERKQSSIILTTHSMEEAEALATKMGIMVNGNLKCIGTSQHIKSKFGGGYEIEVKLELPTKQEIEGLMARIAAPEKALVESDQVDLVLQALNSESLKDEIKEDGAGSVIHSELQQKGKISVSLLVEWIMIEKYGEQLTNFFNENFGEVNIIEHFQSFYRFKAVNNITIGNFFGLLEKNKSELRIQQYSIKQGSIEQIFNNFAALEHAQPQQG